MIKKFSIALIALVALAVVVALVLPREWKVTRSVVINAPVAKIHPWFIDLKRWQDWSPWTRAIDPHLRNIYEGPQDGVGARWAWLGPTMGRGEIEIIDADEKRGLSLAQKIESDEVNAHARIDYSDENGATRVTWTDSGTLPLLGGVFLGTVELELSAHMDSGLQKLKTLAEQ